MKFIALNGLGRHAPHNTSTETSRQPFIKMHMNTYNRSNSSFKVGIFQKLVMHIFHILMCVARIITDKDMRFQVCSTFVLNY